MMQLQHGIALAQGQDALPDHWILLDSQSTVSIFRNRAMLTTFSYPSNNTCPITVYDAKRACIIYVLDIPALKGKTNTCLASATHTGLLTSGDVWNTETPH